MTGRYIGEDLVDPRSDTLFLTMPISWQETLLQYAERFHNSKKEVVIYDYVDQSVSMLTKMAERRMKGYGKLRYSLR